MTGDLEAFNRVLAYDESHDTSDNGPNQIACILAYLDEWELSIPFILEKGPRHSDGAGWADFEFFWTTRFVLYPEKFQKAVRGGF